MAMPKPVQVGFECEFVEKPTQFFQTECPICLLILRNPYQVVCCGKSYCQSCIERAEKDKMTCPHCKEKNFTIFPNKGLQQSLYQCPVYCSNKEEGCKWSGELGELDKHLNLEPTAEKQLEGCDHLTIKCLYCEISNKRQQIRVHQTEQCPNRPYTCEFCQVYRSVHGDVDNNQRHLQTCGCVPVECTNGCDHFPQRQNLDTHIAKDCPLTVIDCDFHYTGCDVKLPRKDMPEHLTATMVSHMSMLATRNRTLLTRVDELERENESLRYDVTVITKHLPIIPLDITMPHFAQHQRTDDAWYSQPFYTNFQGYKLCLKVHANDSWIAKEKHMSVFVCLIKGEFDEMLEWPCRGDIIIQLLDRLGKETIAKPIEFMGDRVRGGYKVDYRNVVDFLAETELKHYVNKDTVTFRVKRFFHKT